MNRHRDDLALVTDFGDFRRDSHVRARGTASLGHVVVRPTIVLTQDCRCERHVAAAAKALALQAARLQKLLAEPLTRPLGSMQAPHRVPSEEAATLVQTKKELEADESDEASPASLTLHTTRSRFDGAQTARPGYELELTTQSETVLQRVRDQAHARLASLEADAANGEASQRNSGLTDARNALRNAYAAGKLRSPNAPPRSAAKNAGIVDGWERLQGPKPGRTHTRAALPWAAGLGACSMLLAYALTLSVVRQSDPAQPSAAVATEAVRTDPLARSELNDPPAPDAPNSQAQPHTNTGSKTQRPATRPTARMDCREHSRSPRQ